MRITRFAQAFAAVCLFPVMVALGDASGLDAGMSPGVGGALTAAILIAMAIGLPALCD